MFNTAENSLSDQKLTPPKLDHHTTQMKNSEKFKCCVQS